jgi:LysM repeat protein
MSTAERMNEGSSHKLALLGVGLVAGLAGVAATGVSANADTVHTVQANENLSTIAKNANTTVSALASANGISNEDLIYVGQQVKIDGTTSGAVDTNATTYVTKAGDTLSSIANRFGTTVANLKAANGLTSDVIYINQTLKLKVVEATTSVATSTVPASSTASTASAVVPTSSVASSAAPASSVAQPSIASTAPAQSTSNTVTPSATTTSNTNTNTVSTTNSSASKEWIAQRESGGSYTAQNGRYYGRYQLDKSYLHGDYSAANQERVATQYMQSRYGSWDAAKAAWQSQGWW